MCFFLHNTPSLPLHSSISRAYIFRVVIDRRHYTLIAMRRNVRTQNSHLCMCRSSWWSSQWNPHTKIPANTRQSMVAFVIFIHVCALSTVSWRRARCGNSIFFLRPISIAAPMGALIILLSAFCSGREFKTRISFEAQEFPTATCNSFSGPRRVWLFALCRVDTTQKNIYNCAISSSDRRRMGKQRNATLLNWRNSQRGRTEHDFCQHRTGFFYILRYCLRVQKCLWHF